MNISMYYATQQMIQRLATMWCKFFLYANTDEIDEVDFSYILDALTDLQEANESIWKRHTDGEDDEE